MAVHTLISVDFETTGLDSEKNEIIEIGAVKFMSDGPRLDSFSQLADPTVQISKEAEGKHGIKKSMLSGMPNPWDAWLSFIDWCGEFDAFVSHNAAFEAAFIQTLYKRQKMECPQFMLIDTLKIARNRLDEPSYSLESLSGHKGLHRALSDAEACMDLYLKLASTYDSGKISKRQHVAIGKFDEPILDSNLPTKRQLDYIRDLGGDPDRARRLTKSEASQYIDKLKSKTVTATEKQRAGTTFFEKFLIVAAVLFAIIYAIRKLG